MYRLCYNMLCIGVWNARTSRDQDNLHANTTLTIHALSWWEFLQHSRICAAIDNYWNTFFLAPRDIRKMRDKIRDIVPARLQYLRKITMFTEKKNE